MKTELIDLDSPFPIQKIKKEDLGSFEEQQKHLTVGQFLQFYDIVDNNLTALLYEITEIKKTIESIKSSKELKTGSLDLQDKIYKSLYDVLERDYKDIFVAITYDGKILASDENNVGLLNKLKKLNYPSSQIFIRKVGKKAVAGWGFEP